MLSGDEGAKRFDRCGGRELGTCNPRIEHEHRQLIWRDVQRSSAGGIEKAKHSDREKQCEEEVAKGATSTGAATAAGIITTLASLSTPDGADDQQLLGSLSSVLIRRALAYIEQTWPELAGRLFGREKWLNSLHVDCKVPHEPAVIVYPVGGRFSTITIWKISDSRDPSQSPPPPCPLPHPPRRIAWLLR